MAGRTTMTDEAGLTVRERKFADFYVSGVFANRALILAGYSQNGAVVTASKLLRKKEVEEYIKAERERMAEESKLERMLLVRWLWEVVKTPMQGLDDRSDMVQEYVIKETWDGGVRKQVKMVSKLGAAKQLTTMLGWDKPEKEAGGDPLTAFLRKLRSGG